MVMEDKTIRAMSRKNQCSGFQIRTLAEQPYKMPKGFEISIVECFNGADALVSCTVTAQLICVSNCAADRVCLCIS